MYANTGLWAMKHEFFANLYATKPLNSVTQHVPYKFDCLMIGTT